ncbi:MAG: hypothetical protein AAGF83_22340 [Cyanobacteria bacterium P01_G01_bin.67]
MNIEQERQLAKDETTPPDTLANLANSEDIQTRKYFASNPNTPVKILLKICFEFPQEVIENPIIPLLILENSDLSTCKILFWIIKIPDLSTCKICLDFNEIKQLTDIEIKRLGWTKVIF